MKPNLQRIFDIPFPKKKKKLDAFDYISSYLPNLKYAHVLALKLQI